MDATITKSIETAKMAVFTHMVDKSAIPACNIMGVDISAINMNWLLSFVQKNIRDLSGDYICVANVHTTVTAFENESYKAVQNNAILSIPDGGPLSTVGHRRGYKEMMRTTGPGFMEEIFRVSAKYNYRHCFYGSTQDTLDRLKSKLLKEYPGLRIADMYAPPFRTLSKEEDAAIVERINAARADFIWVGLGAPKQEIWMAAHQGRVKGLMCGVGAGFDYFAGNIKRAPVWMQNNNLEWCYRLIQDPFRLFQRYWHTNWKFVWYVFIRGK